MSFKDMTPEEKEAELAQTEEMKNVEFMFTCRVYEAGSGRAVTLPARWGFKEGDIVQIKVVDRNGKWAKAYKRVCKQSSRNNSHVVFLDKIWDLDWSRFVTISVNLIGRNCPPSMLKKVIYRLQLEGTFDESDFWTDEGVYIKKAD